MNLLRTLHRRIRARHIAIALVGLAVLLAPALAMAIPGAGEFTTLESPSGRQMAELYNILAKICLVIFIIVCTIMFAAILRFRRRSEDERPEQVHGNMKIEMGILVAASLVQIYIGIKTIDTMWYVEKLPETQITVEAIAYKWDWKFRYPDHGGLVTDDLVIPAYTNVKLEVTSEDVIHSLFIPELGVKIDAVPGRFNYWWVNADGPLNQVIAEVRGVKPTRAEIEANQYKTTRPDNLPLLQVLNTLTFVEESERPEQVRGLERQVGYLGHARKDQVGDDRYVGYDAVEYRGMCTELCGSGHYDMYFRTVAMTPESFERWIQEQKTGGGGSEGGPEIYNGKCASCHSGDGKGVAGQFPPLANSDYISADTEENKNRHIKVVLDGLKGEIVVNGVTYNGVMQPWYDQLNDEEVAAVVNHERTSWGNSYGEVDAKRVAEVRESLGYPPFPAGGATPVPERDLVAEGEKIYAACASCHGMDGRKGKHKISGSPMVLSDINGYLSMLVNGTNQKSAMGRSMTDRQLAAIITYTRSAFGNDASAVQPSEVRTRRPTVTEPLAP